MILHGVSRHISSLSLPSNHDLVQEKRYPYDVYLESRHLSAIVNVKFRAKSLTNNYSFCSLNLGETLLHEGSGPENCFPHEPLAMVSSQLLNIHVMGGFGPLFDFTRIQLKYVVSDAFSSGTPAVECAVSMIPFEARGVNISYFDDILSFWDESQIIASVGK
jgi:hypothetical protein